MSKKKKEAISSWDTFRLSEEEFFSLNVVNSLVLGCVLSPRIHREWREAWRLGDQYPFRDTTGEEVMSDIFCMVKLQTCCGP